MNKKKIVIISCSAFIILVVIGIILARGITKNTDKTDIEVNNETNEIKEEEEPKDLNEGIVNGNLDNGIENWGLYLRTPAIAMLTEENGEMKIAIENVGSGEYYVQA